MAHPGITVDFIGAIIIKTMHPLLPLEDLNQLVLTRPEIYLTAISRTFIFFNAVGLLILGLVGFFVFGDWLPAIILQLGPVLSKLVFKWLGRLGDVKNMTRLQ